MWIDAGIRGFDGISCYLFDASVHQILEVILFWAVFAIQVSLKFLVTDFITFFVFSVVFTVFLDCVVGEMHR
jgi:hypothetical protein